MSSGIIKSFLPGPTWVNAEVLAQMARQPVSHRSKEASTLQRSITTDLQKLLYTQGKVLLSTSSATGMLEGAMQSLVNKRAIIFSNGAFGERWAMLAAKHSIPHDVHIAAWGVPIMPETVDQYLRTGKYDVAAITHNETSTGIANPIAGVAEIIKKYPDIIWIVDAVSSAAGAKIEVDALGIDVLLTSVQKALALPPGMAIATVSPKAEQRIRTIGSKGYYFDFCTLLDFIEKNDHQYHSTLSTSHLFALQFQLERIMQEGLDNRWARHSAMAEYMIGWANTHFKTFAPKGFESKTLTVVENTKGIDLTSLHKRLLTQGYVIGSGYGKLKEIYLSYQPHGRNRAARLAGIDIGNSRNYKSLIFQESC